MDIKQFQDSSLQQVQISWDTASQSMQFLRLLPLLPIQIVAG